MSSAANTNALGKPSVSVVYPPFPGDVPAATPGAEDDLPRDGEDGPNAAAPGDASATRAPAASTAMPVTNRRFTSKINNKSNRRTNNAGIA